MMNVWDNKWKIVVLFLVLFVYTSYLLVQSGFLYFIFYRNLLTTPAQEFIHQPLYLRFDSPSRERTPETNLFIHRNKLTYKQTYRMTIYLELPESPNNFDIGMFMLNLTNNYVSDHHSDLSLFDKNILPYRPDTIIAGTSLRPATLHWKSGLQRSMDIVFYSIPLVLGIRYFEPKQYMTVVMFDDFVFNPPSGFPHLDVVFQISDPNIQVYNAHIEIDAQLYGLSYVCYYNYYTCFFVGTSLIFVLHILFNVVLFLAMILLYYRNELLNLNETIQHRPIQHRQPRAQHNEHNNVTRSRRSS
eukprot:TRINITY_DN3695_c0_g1_i1.p1 TRINITY_DN3695_c0_g1~~TRINITY_DN3695_c0_g1_i1.p1  ORF type:complete len:301 (-),score=22.73 TRINITY_DN3695_c0_g1_i1:65-967(-)